MNKKLIMLSSILLASQVTLANINSNVTFTEVPYGACAQKFTVEVAEGKISSFKAVKGCPGNLNALSKLLPGMEVSDVITILDDNYCSSAPLAGYTSCMDNLVEMLKYHVMGEGEGHVNEIREKVRNQEKSFAFSTHICNGCGICNATLA